MNKLITMTNEEQEQEQVLESLGHTSSFKRRTRNDLSSEDEQSPQVAKRKTEHNILTDLALDLDTKDKAEEPKSSFRFEVKYQFNVTTENVEPDKEHAQEHLCQANVAPIEDTATVIEVNEVLEDGHTELLQYDLQDHGRGKLEVEDAKCVVNEVHQVLDKAEEAQESFAKADEPLEQAEKVTTIEKAITIEESQVLDASKTIKAEESLREKSQMDITDNVHCAINEVNLVLEKHKKLMHFDSAKESLVQAEQVLSIEEQNTTEDLLAVDVQSECATSEIALFLENHKRLLQENLMQAEANLIQAESSSNQIPLVEEPANLSSLPVEANEANEDDEEDPLNFIQIKSAAQWKAVSKRISWNFGEEEQTQASKEPEYKCDKATIIGPPPAAAVIHESSDQAVDQVLHDYDNISYDIYSPECTGAPPDFKPTK